jgi:hypothetical protein
MRKIYLNQFKKIVVENSVGNIIGERFIKDHTPFQAYALRRRQLVMIIRFMDTNIWVPVFNAIFHICVRSGPQLPIWKYGPR